MSTTTLGLENGYASLDNLPAADVAALADAIEATSVSLAEHLPNGVLNATDWNLAIVAGSLAVDVSAGFGIVGASGGKRPVRTTSTYRVTGLSASTTNYIFAQRDGTFTSNTTGVAPANAEPVGTATTNGTEATGVNHAAGAGGRVNLGALANLLAAQTLANKTLSAIQGDLDHDGTKCGFNGAAPIAKPTAYTQTYSTTTRTHSNLTSATLTDNTAGTANTTCQAIPDPADTPVDADALRDDLVTNALPAIRNNFADVIAQVNALRVDLVNLKGVVNSLIDDGQSYGLLQ